MSPTQRSLAHVRKLGWTAQVVERWNQYAGVRQDLFGAIDVLCLLPTRGGCTGIQSTTGSNVSKRCRKIEDEPIMARWLQAGNGLLVHGWAKRGPRGKAKRWSLRAVEAKLVACYGQPLRIEWEEQIEAPGADA